MPELKKAADASFSIIFGRPEFIALLAGEYGNFDCSGFYLK